MDISGGNIKLTNTNSPFGAGLYSNNNVYLGGNQYLDITAGVYKAVQTGTSHRLTLNSNTGFHFNAPSVAGGTAVTNTEAMRLSVNGGLSLGSTYVGTDAGAGNMMLSGSLGIGTTTVGSKLVVQGASNASTTSSLNVTGSDGGSHLFVRDDGNIGVGTSNPLFKLEVAGTASTTALNVVGNINNATLTANSLVITDANKNLASSGIVVNNIISSVATGTAGNIFNISTTTNSLTINLPFANINNTGQPRPRIG